VAGSGPQKEEQPASLQHIFTELRYYEDRARSDEETRDGRLATLVALSGAVLGLLAASLPEDGLCGIGLVVFCLAVLSFALAILVATQFAIRIPLLTARFGGRLERVTEPGREEFESYLTEAFQTADPDLLRRRVLPVMTLAIGIRRRNAARKERCLDLAVWLIAAGILMIACYVAILAL
jgi:hypothetical protein